MMFYHSKKVFLETKIKIKIKMKVKMKIIKKN